MMKTVNNSITLSLILGLLFALSCTPLPDNDSEVDEVVQKPLLGAWDMTSINWITADTIYSIEHAQPGVFIVDEHRYATMWTPIEEMRTPFENLSKPTEEEMIAGFKTVVFNAGTYEMTDSTLTTTAVIAKVPGFEGGIQYYSYQIKGDILTLRMFDETYPNGEKPEWSGVFETEFVFNRAK